MPTPKFLAGIDLVGQQLFNALMELVAGDKGTPANGQVWYNSSTNKFRGRANGTTVTFVNDGGDLTAGSVANTALATNPLARANHTGTQTASTISDLATVVQAYRLDQFAAPNVAWSAGSQRITNVSTPTGASDAANKSYVDGLINGLSWKSSVRAASTANGTLASAFANGSVLDGVTLATNDEILLKNQTTGGENGVYIVQATGAPVRRADMDAGSEFWGAAVNVREGTTNANTQWQQTVDTAITVGTTATTWVQFGGGQTYIAGNGLTLSTNTFNIGAGNGITVNADDIQVDATVVVRKYSTLIGDGTTTAIAVTHSLGSKDVLVVLRDATSDELIGSIYAVATSTSVVTITFPVAPTTNQYRVTVHV